MKAADKIWLYGIACQCRIGVPDLERRKPQNILLDVGVEMDLRKPAKSDDVKDALDYQALERRVRAAAESGEFRLLERLASKIAHAVLAFDRLALSVTIRAHKKPTTMPKTREVTVEITRQRSSQ